MPKDAHILTDPFFEALERARQGLEDAARIAVERSTSNAAAIVAGPYTHQIEALADLRTIVEDLVRRIEKLETGDA